MILQGSGVVSSGSWRVISLTALAEALALSVWFAGSAIVPQLSEEWYLSPGEQSWMTRSVQLGFVVGALSRALVNLADRVPLHRLFGLSALGAALMTAAITMAPGPALGLWSMARLRRLPEAKRMASGRR